jgi:hypothetical protein
MEEKILKAFDQLLENTNQKYNSNLNPYDLFKAGYLMATDHIFNNNDLLSDADINEIAKIAVGYDEDNYCDQQALDIIISAIKTTIQRISFNLSHKTNDDKKQDIPKINNLQEERNNFLEKCGSCLNFKFFMAEAGFCKISECNCICKNPKAMIDMWDDKCNKWIINPEYL